MIKFLMLLTIFSAGLLIASDNEGEELIEIIVPPKPVQQTAQQLPETQSINQNAEATPKLLAPPNELPPRPKTPAHGSKRK
jgi:hypothetical protein